MVLFSYRVDAAEATQGRFGLASWIRAGVG
jgi:hypothetical protein